MLLVGNQSEKEYRDNQTKFGHLNKGSDITEWLSNEYWPGSIREKRYYAVAEKFLEGRKDLSVLEIAAGAGDYIMYISKLFPYNHYFVNELSETQLVGNIKKVANHFGVNVLPEMSFGPVENLTYIDETFDVIFIKAAVHHFEDPKKGFGEIYRVLKKGGRTVFFEDPVCLDIPIYRTWKKENFSLSERALGINEHIYTISNYLSFGALFSRKDWYLDQVLVDEYDRQQIKRRRVKKFFGSIVRRWSFLFRSFMIWRFSAVVFVFEK